MSVDNLDHTWNKYFRMRGKSREELSVGARASIKKKSNKKTGDVEETTPKAAPGDTKIPYLRQKRQVSRRLRSQGYKTGSRAYSFLQAMRLIDKRFELEGDFAAVVDYSKEPVILTQPSRLSLIHI